ncbi:MAG: cyclase family protein [Solirubrobacterales bacterium]
MEIVDLSVAFAEGMPKFPAAWFPAFAVDEVDAETNGSSRRFTAMRMFAHNGTHVESANHVMRDGATIDSAPLGCFAGLPVIVDLRDVPERAEVPLDVIRERLPVGEIRPGQVVLLMTGYNDRHWGRAEFWERSPWLSVEAAEHVAAVEPALIGLDFQTERPGADDLPVHHALFARGAVLCEYLFNLDQIDAQTLFLALPIKVDGVEAAPVRAIGIKHLGEPG